MVTVCLLSASPTVPKEFKEIWPKHKPCQKRNMFYRGGIYNVYFPNIPELRNADGGYKISYKEVKEVLQFEDIGNGVWKGSYESN